MVERYSYEPSTLGGGVIKRHDADHARTVAIIDNRDQFRKFVLAIEQGKSEVEAVHAIDDE